ncbi:MULTISPECIES: flagellar filament capping protein FliD [Clostridia]|uniref:flagellar filament capping protein FliD n=1 Tax=Clostridia TaxID=186801 RepID=UPI0018A6AAD3|nr:flagellar filament capping protein FliD [Clostridium sp. WB02_MRS01]
MASVYNNVASNSLSSSVRGYGGLASGLDRDNLIKGMTAATRAKIAKQEKSKQSLLWKQDAYRSISSKLVEFSRKYTSYSYSSTNLSSPAFWASNNVTAIGANSKYVQVSGSSSVADSISIVGVKQLAQKASVISNDRVSDGALETGMIDLNENKMMSTLEGQSLTFQYGNKTFSVSLQSGVDKNGDPYDYSTEASTVDAINRSLKEVAIGDGKTLADVLEATYSSKLDFKSVDPNKNEIRLAGGSKGAMEALGISDSNVWSQLVKDGKTVIGEAGMSAEIMEKDQTLYKNKSFEELVNEKSMSFTYNGVTKSIVLSSQGSMAELAKDINTKLEKEFGKGRINVTVVPELDANGDPKDPARGMLKFETIKPDGTTDDSSNLMINYGDAEVRAALQVVNGESNRLNLDAAVGESGLKITDSLSNPLKIVINGVNINEDGTLTDKSTLNQIMEKINRSDAGVTVSYMRDADKFSFVAKEEGASGEIKFDLEGADNEKLFGAIAKPITNPDDSQSAAKYSGKDAIVLVKYAGSPDQVELTRGSNTFDLNGLNVTVSGTFNESGTGGADQAVTFNAKTDSDKITKAVSEMIKDYNDIIKLVNDQISTKPNRKYEPLTDEQKAEMSEKQIEQWEAKAKEGLLFNDPDLRGLSDSMRFIFEGGSEKKALLESYGISTSNKYQENGALVFDEVKFRAALEKSGEDLQKLFTDGADTLTGDKGGVMTRLTAITDKYASETGATKGILIEKAGSSYAPVSILNNNIKKSVDRIDDYIERLQSQLKSETDRYIKQFTSLETLISQMNSQSSWLQSSFGGQ